MKNQFKDHKLVNNQVWFVLNGFSNKFVDPVKTSLIRTYQLFRLRTVLVDAGRVGIVEAEREGPDLKDKYLIEFFTYKNKKTWFKS